MRQLLCFFLAVLCLSCNTSNNNNNNSGFFSAENENFHYAGRFFQTGNGVELINSAASVETKVYGDSVFVYVESGNQQQHHYISIEIGEEYIGRFRIKNDTMKFALPVDEQGSNVKIYKDTEASNGSVIFKGISAEKIEAVQPEEMPKIEFIGNSITCGMGTDTREIDCEEGEWYDQHNAYLAYGPRVARALQIDYVLNCVSGMGMYRNWNDEDQAVMADVYPTLRLNGNKDEQADFKGTPPDVVSIALGTNDLSLGDGVKERTDFNHEKFTQKYILFVEMIFSKYPDTKIALLSSPMIGEKENNLLVTSLNKVKDHFNDEEIFIFEFEKMQPGGCTSHPNIKDHSLMAEKLIPFFKEILNK